CLGVLGLFALRFGLQRRDLLGDVDADRAPHDAPPASDAAGAAELVVPGPQLVGEPMPVPAVGGGADRAAVQVGEGQVAAGGRVLPRCGVATGQGGALL